MFQENKKRAYGLLLILSLGYFVDYFDLTILAATRGQILAFLGVPQSQILTVSTLLFNSQSYGILVGGLLSGVWGDKGGRMSAVRWGIALYSTATILNIFCTTVPTFALCRFFAGIGLAGELAASVTLVSELAQTTHRGFLAGIIYSVGVLGGIFATLMGAYFPWQKLFLLGGILGFCLLLIRLGTRESHLFLKTKQNKQIRRGSIALLLLTPHSLKRLLLLTLIFAPFWLLVFSINFGPEVSAYAHTPISQTTTLLCFFIGSVVGALLFARLGDLFGSRRKSILCALMLILALIYSLFFISHFSGLMLLAFFIASGLLSGYCIVGMSFTTEQFGTNQRAIATSVISCTGRFSAVILNSSIIFAASRLGSLVYGIMAIGTFVLAFALFAIYSLQETHGKSLDYLEGK